MQHVLQDAVKFHPTRAVNEGKNLVNYMHEEIVTRQQVVGVSLSRFWVVKHRISLAYSCSETDEAPETDECGCQECGNSHARNRYVRDLNGFVFLQTLSNKINGLQRMLMFLNFYSEPSIYIYMYIF